MTPPIISPRFRRRRLWLILPAAIVVTFMLTVVLFGVGLFRSFGLSSDAAALRDGLMKSAAADWNREIEVGVGSFALNLARTALTFVRLEPEARAALRAFRGGDVGVYQRQHRQKRLDHAALLDAADKTMTARGWDRMVGVVGQDELMAIYVPRRVSSPRDMRICLVALNGQELVVASVRSNLEPLLELARSRPEWPQKRWASIQF